MTKILRTLWLTLTATLLLNATPYAGPTAMADDLMEQVSHYIKAQLTRETIRQNLVCQGELICGVRLMPLYYQQRQYTPVWIDSNGLRPAAQDLIRAIQNAHQDGLHPEDYHAGIINMLLSDYDYWPMDSDNSNQASIRADLDLLLTDAFLLLGTHLNSGRIDPETLHADWIVPEEATDVMEVLHKITKGADLDSALDTLRPSHDGYLELQYALKKMRQLQAGGGWPIIGSGAVLKPGDRDSRIPVLRSRLIISGDLQTPLPQDETDHYDELLKAAVMRFQQRHGLKPDGIIGSQTLKALNVTVDQRVRQIELNLERWRWLPHNLAQRYIMINAANFDLQVIEDKQPVLQMRVVVGRPARRTPVFSAPVSYLVINPYWTVPHKLAVEDILPKLAKGVDYLTRQGFKVFKGWGENSKTIDPTTVNWNIYSKTYFPFLLRQDPGPKNALGRIKFMMPNKFSVYLHDTPQRSLFYEVKRDFSSGCIRVQNARALANYLLANETAWPPERLETYLSNGQRKIVRLAEPIPVHLLYMTAWLDHTGVIHFRNDIYKRDHDLKQALVRRQPAPLPLLPTSDASAAFN